MKVAVVVPPYEAIASPWPTTPAREMTRADELAEAMANALAIDVPVLEVPLASAPADAYLLAFHFGPWVVTPEVARRVIALDEGRAYVMKHVEQFGFAGAVEKHRYFQWRTQRDTERGYGLIGRKEVVARMSAHLPGLPYTSANYGVIESDTARDLPGLIAEYLRAYDAMP